MLGLDEMINTLNPATSLSGVPQGFVLCLLFMVKHGCWRNSWDCYVFFQRTALALLSSNAIVSRFTVRTFPLFLSKYSLQIRWFHFCSFISHTKCVCFKKKIQMAIQIGRLLLKMKIISDYLCKINQKSFWNTFLQGCQIAQSIISATISKNTTRPILVHVQRKNL